MNPIPALGALVACAFAVSVPSLVAQQPAGAADEFLRLRFATFDPLAGEPALSEPLTSQGGSRLWIVQFAAAPTQAGRDAIARAGGTIHAYLPDNAYVARMDAAAAARVTGDRAVRWVGRYHAAYRLDPALQAALHDGSLQPARYNMVVVDKRNDKPALAAHIRAIGGVVDDEHPGGLLFTATLTPAQLVAAAHLDEVLWIDAWSAPELDMDNARVQGGGNYVEAQAGYTGAGVKAHIYEGIEAAHQDFTGGATNVRSGGAADTHGHCTAGIVFGNGTSNPIVRGMAPDAGKFYTNYSSVSGSRWQVVSDLVNIHGVSHTTASWGGGRVLTYTSISADTDDIIFDHDIAWTQSQSNAGNQQSRPEAWAKNVFSIGGVAHGNNSNPLDDSWQAGNGSTGPAADGRIKPDLCAYYDGIGTSDRTGSAGYSSGNWYASFGGTSGATPIVAGHNVLAIQMFTDDSATPGFGPFGNALRNPNAPAASFVHENRPHFTTLKALQIASARQYAFTAASTDNRREHVGWGFPNLQTMWDMRGKTVVVDETSLITQGLTHQYSVQVGAGEPAFRAVLCYNEPPAAPSASPTLINNLSLRVTSPNNTIYWGNVGLTQGNWSLAGGAADAINPLECVFVQNPQAGSWTVEVIATLVVADNHVETPTVDADYALVITGGQGQPPTNASFSKFGQGCAGSPNTVTPCAQLNENGGTLVGNVTNLEYGIIPTSIGGIQVTSFELFLRTTGGTQVVPARLYAALGATPLASTTMTVGPTAGFYTATFATPVPVPGSYFIAVDLSSGNVVVPNLTSGGTAAVFTRPSGPGGWTYDPTVTRPAYRVHCTAGTVYDVPTLGNVGDPEIGTSYGITLSMAVPSSGAFILTGFSDAAIGATPLPAPLPGAPGCNLLVSADATKLLFTSATGTASDSIAVPNDPSFIGIDLFHQWAVLDPTVNTLGIVVSDAGRARLGD